MMSRRLVLALVALLVGSSACKEDTKEAASDVKTPSSVQAPPEDETPKPPTEKPEEGAAAEKVVRSSCDERSKKGYCTDAFEAAWEMGEKHVRSNCNLGVFADKPCPEEKLLGHCDVGQAYRVSYYKDTSRKYDQASAKAACDDEFAGAFAPVN